MLALKQKPCKESQLFATNYNVMDSSGSHGDWKCPPNSSIKKVEPLKCFYAIDFNQLNRAADLILDLKILFYLFIYVSTREKKLFCSRFTSMSFETYKEQICENSREEKIKKRVDNHRNLWLKVTTPFYILMVELACKIHMVIGFTSRSVSSLLTQEPM